MRPCSFGGYCGRVWPWTADLPIQSGLQNDVPLSSNGIRGTGVCPRSGIDSMGFDLSVHLGVLTVDVPQILVAVAAYG